MKIEIVPSELRHVRELALSIREKDQDEARALGLAPHRGLHFAYTHATLRRTCLVDGSVAAMWGVCGTPLGIAGQPYLITGTVVNQISPVKFARIYIKEVESMRNLFPVLENYVHADYIGAVKMLQLAGFELSDKLIINGSDFYRFSMRSE